MKIQLCLNTFAYLYLQPFGIVYIEALSCGIPIIGYGPSVKEIEEKIGMQCGWALKYGTDIKDDINKISCVGLQVKQKGSTTSRQIGQLQARLWSLLYSEH